MDDDEFRGLAYESAESIWEEVEYEHRTEDEAADTALLHRQHARYVEIMWVRSFPNARMIVITCPAVSLGDLAEMPGVVRSLPVGIADCANPLTFYARFLRTVASYEAEGWVSKDPTVQTGGAA